MKTKKEFSRKSMRSMLSKKMKKILPDTSVVLILILFGCAQKPVPGIPFDISPQQVLNAIEKRKSLVRDFKGRARAKALIKGEEQPALVYINYKKPDRFRIMLKGAFGVVLAVITTNSDSLTVYIPSLKGYIVTGKDDRETLRLIFSGRKIPDVSLDIDYLTALFNGITPAADISEQPHIAFKRRGDRADLTITNGSLSYQYTVAGPGLLLKKEVMLVDGKPVMSFAYDKYTPIGDKSLPEEKFPHTIIMADEASELRLDFSSCAVNKGLSDSELLFELPPNADRLTLNRTGDR